MCLRFFQYEKQISVIFISRYPFEIKTFLNFSLTFYFSFIRLLIIKKEKKRKKMSQDSIGINEYNLLIQMVKMKVKFPCRMKI